MTATTTTATSILKRLYPQKALLAGLYKKGPLIGLMPKSTKFVGDDMRIAIQIAPTTGRSASFATAQAKVGGNAYRGFNLTRVKDYSIMRIETELLQASASDEGALVRGLKAAVRNPFAFGLLWSEDACFMGEPPGRLSATMDSNGPVWKIERLARHYLLERYQTVLEQ